MRILVLGGSGFVGRNVVPILRKQGNEVITSSPSIDGLDLRVPGALLKRLDAIRPEVVLNLAAQVGSLNYVSRYAADVISSNSRMLLEVYESLRMHDSGVLLVNPIANCGYPGESNDYEENTFWDGPIHESVLAYGFTRRMIDVLSRCYAAQYGLDSANFFVPNMYGPHDSTDPEKTHALNALVLRTVKARYEGTPSITLWGSGSPVREWLFAPDFGRFLVSFLESGKRTISINVAQNHGLSIKDLMGLVVQRAAYQGTVEWDRSKQDGAPYKTMNDRQFRAIFPDFRFTTLDDGIDATVEYYKSVYPF